MLKKPHLFGFGLAVVLAAGFLNLPSGTAARLKLAISGLFLPLFGAANTVQNLGEAASARATPKSTLIHQIEDLRRQNEELKIRSMEADEIARENDILRDAVDWQKRLPWKVRLARILSRDPANWWRTLQIDLGSDDGVTKNMPVITADGLVGRVQEVTSSYARVMLLGDPKCQVPAVVDNATRDTGILMPGEASVLDESIVQLTYLSRNSQAIPGQKVFTSGLGGIFPKGIPIGQIIETNSVDYGLYLEARVKLSADLREIEEVWVLYP